MNINLKTSCNGKLLCHKKSKPRQFHFQCVLQQSDSLSIFLQFMQLTGLIFYAVMKTVCKLFSNGYTGLRTAGYTNKQQTTKAFHFNTEKIQYTGHKHLRPWIDNTLIS